MADPMALSYHAACVYKSEAATLAPFGWLNDSILTFWMEYLSYDVFPLQAQDVCLVHPGTAYLHTLLEPEDFVEAVEGLSLKSKRFVIAAINDSDSPATSLSGSHWSLLVFDSIKRTFYHFDSGNGTNAHAARHAATAFWAALRNGKERFPGVTDAGANRQANGYDCGVHAAMTAEVILAAGAVDIAAVKAKVTPAAVADYRRRMLATLNSLAIAAK